MSSNTSGWFGINKLRSWLPRWQWANDNSISRTFRNYLYNSDTPVLINKDDLLTPYLECPHLQTVINKKAEMFANGEWKCYAASDVDNENPLDDEGLALLNKPNPLQSREDFLWQYIFYKEVFANNFIYKLSGSTLVLPKVLWHLPSDLMKTSLTGKFFDQYELEGIIKNFILCYSGEEKKYEIKDIIFHATNFSYTEGMGLSKIPGLNYPISNIMAALKTRNIISVKKGMIGILSNEGKDNQGGSLPIKSGERERIEKQFADDRGLYGERENIIISQSAVKWNPTSFPVRDLMLLEANEEDFASILGAYGMDRDIFPSTKGATFENKKQGLITTYENTIQPEADSFAGMMTTALGADKRGKKYVLDYSWMPLMQEDKGDQETAEKTKAEKLATLYGYNIISREEFAKQMGVDLAEEIAQAGGDTLGKIPLALQQIAMARERANTAGDKQLSELLGTAMDKLTAQLAKTIIQDKS